MAVLEGRDLVTAYNAFHMRQVIIHRDMALRVNRIFDSFQHRIHSCIAYWNDVGRDSSAGIATLYGLHGPGIEFLADPNGRAV